MDYSNPRLFGAYSSEPIILQHIQQNGLELSDRIGRWSKDLCLNESVKWWLHLASQLQNRLGIEKTYGISQKSDI